MRIICIDDEPLAVEYTVELCRALEGVEATGFASAREALGYLRTHPVDAAILDVNMPEMDGIALAARIREVSPDTAVILLTAHREYALEAYAVHPSGYLLKPATLEKLAAEIAYACRKKAVTGPGRVKVKTFGNFDVYVDDRPVSFKLGKAKELLAYLVDKQGAGVTRGGRSSPPSGKIASTTGRCRSSWTSTSVPCAIRCGSTAFRRSWRWKKAFFA